MLSIETNRALLVGNRLSSVLNKDDFQDGTITVRIYYLFVANMYL